MIRKILTLIFIFFLGIQSVFAEGEFKITSVNLDTSNSLILLTSSKSQVPEEVKNIKINTLSAPRRFYFDLPSTILTTGAQNWFFNSEDIKQVKISQFTPDIVRVVLYTSENFDKSKMEIIKQDKTLILQFKDEICEKDYFNPVYTDEKISSSKFYEQLSVSNTEIGKLKEAQDVVSKDKLSQVESAFSQPSEQTENIIKELKLKTNYYISSLNVRNSSVLISGFGDATIEKPLYLTNPTRIVYDLPNSITNYAIRNKVHTSNGIMMKIAQFDAFRSRLVITPPVEGVDYVPVFSPDGQSVLFVKEDNLAQSNLYNQTNNATGFYSNNKEELIISFDSPVVHSVKREDDVLKINLYNTYSYNEENFKKVVQKTVYEYAQTKLMPKAGLALEIPITKNTVVKTYMGADGKAIKVLLKNAELRKPKKKLDKIQKIKGEKLVVIDAGHGGTDFGAMREDVNEKDINLEVSKMVVELLKKAGVTVLMTRDTDEFISLQDRVDISMENDADLFVSIHVNASVKPEIVGLETHYYNENSLNLANTVHENMVHIVDRTDRGVFKSKFYVINHNTMPAILVEIGFISNEEERKELLTRERKKKTAQAIARGIIEYLKAN